MLMFYIILFLRIIENLLSIIAVSKLYKLYVAIKSFHKTFALWEFLSECSLFTSFFWLLLGKQLFMKDV